MTAERSAPVGPTASTNSVVRSAVALVINGGLTSALGLVYWFLAARLYPVADVGRNASLISALLLLSALSQLNYSRSIAFLLPAAGRRAGSVLLSAYRRSASLGFAAGLAYTLLAPHFGHDLAYVRQGWLPLAFAGSVAIWVVFSLQDAALTALRSAHIVPVENFVFSATKLVLLVFFHQMHFLSLGIFASWILSLLLCVPAVTLILYRWALPAAVSWSPGLPVTHRARWLWFDTAGYYVYLFGTAPLAIVVLTILGPTVAAAFYLPFTVGSALEVLAFGIGNVLTAHLTRQHGVPDAATRRLVRTTLLAVAALAVLCAGLAPKLLALVGKDYQRGTVLLMCFVVAAVPRTMLVLQMASLRAQKRGGTILALHALTVTVTVGAMVSSILPLGLDGVGYGWLLGSLIGAFAATRFRWPAEPVRARTRPMPKKSP